MSRVTGLTHQNRSTRQMHSVTQGRPFTHTLHREWLGMN